MPLATKEQQENIGTLAQLEIMEIHDRCPESRGMLQPFICMASDAKQYYCKGSNAQVNGLLNGCFAGV